MSRLLVSIIFYLLTGGTSSLVLAQINAVKIWQKEFSAYAVKGVISGAFYSGDEYLCFAVDYLQNAADTLMVTSATTDQVIKIIPGINTRNKPFISKNRVILYLNGTRLYRSNIVGNDTSSLLIPDVIDFSMNEQDSLLYTIEYGLNDDVFIAVYHYFFENLRTEALQKWGLEKGDANKMTMSLSEDKRFLACNYGYEFDKVTLVDLNTNHHYTIGLSGIGKGSYGTAFYQDLDTTFLLVGNGYFGGDLEIIDAERHQWIKSIDAVDYYNYYVEVDHEQKLIFCGGYSGELKIFKYHGSILTEVYSENGEFITDIYKARNAKTLYVSRQRTINSSYMEALHFQESTTPLTLENRPESLLLFPNPTSDWLTVTNIPQGYKTALIYNQAGQVAALINLQGKSEENLDITKLRSGYYLLYLFDAYGHNLKQDFIKE